ncbi:MAG: 50S ribosomal protein L15 [Candidatus Gracilibacteria bacterium]|jgi:large subunit ribosomal protein L15
MKQNTLKSAPGSRKDKIRRGRGRTKGNFSGRGVKGAGARTGAKSRAAFEGGQTPLVRRMPKLKGFNNFNKEVYRTVNLNQLDVFEDGATVNAEALHEKRIVTRKGKIKLLGTGDLKIKLKITVNAASENAKKAVEKAGGELTLIQ